ncbi:Dienelactone hydrolase [Macrophomina phaseolina MS6]|uniref:Dienelactone hydrolase n=1 Tax=Macrophomina phaseolina (strain MS6) TaxID=1126212 RepID=K2RS23_MACPH|nr:Dienelactone hydrolase [Macrophomina phaseolina MS6]
MASNPPGSCCIARVKHEGTAVGRMQKVAGIETYLSYPESKSTENAILIMTDVFGHEFINVQLIADQFAANGYFVAIPDLFNGDAVPVDRPAEFDLMKWLQGHTTPHVDPIIAAVSKELKSSMGAKRLGGVGYCFGAKYVCRFLKDGKIDVGYIAHPSFVDAAELRGIHGPLSISAAETDEIFPASKRRESEDILLDIKATYQINLFPGVEHGFAVRADITKKQIKFAKEQAFLQAVSWFDEHLKA